MIDLTTINWDDVADLAKLDQAGFIPASGEGVRDYQLRVSLSMSALESLCKRLENDGIIDIDGTKMKRETLIPPEILAEGGAVSGRLYDFNIDWAPGFYLSEEVGILWGGSSICDPSNHVSAYFLRSEFRTRNRYFIYDRTELVAHEICHVARQQLNDNVIEEYFAYQTSCSAFRRYVGNCFVHSYEAVVFILASLLPVCGEVLNMFLDSPLPLWAFWAVALTAIGGVLLKNHSIWRRMKAAERRLTKFGVTAAKAVLFRLYYKEIIQLSGLKNRAELLNFAEKRALDGDLRWRIIKYRFLSGESNKTE